MVQTIHYSDVKLLGTLFLQILMVWICFGNLSKTVYFAFALQPLPRLGRLYQIIFEVAYVKEVKYLVVGCISAVGVS